MFRVEKVCLHEILLPLVEPFVTAAGRLDGRRALLAELRLAGDLVGWGECVALAEPTYTPETIDTAWLALERWLVPSVLGASFESPAALGAALGRVVRGHPMARATLETAAWDAAAQAAGKSLAVYLGGARRQVATGLAIGLAGGVDGVAQRAVAARAAGYRRLRLKVRPGEDVAVVVAARSATGHDLPLAVDANAAYTLDDLPALRALDGCGLTMIEQPLGWDDLGDHARLARELATPLCLDESLGSCERARLALELGSCRVLNVKAGRVGGLAAALDLHELGRAAGVPMFVGGMVESGVGRAVNVALASLPGFTLPGDLSPSARYFHEDIVEPAWTMSPEGLVEVPASPGLGVTVDRRRIERLRVRHRELG